MPTSNERLRHLRQKQSLEELERKARKACRLKGNVWTQEEIDAADKNTEILCEFFGVE